MNNSSANNARFTPARSLLPAFSPLTTAASPTTAQTPALAKRPSPVVSACAVCRKRKSRCSGDRPRCTSCARQKTDCLYDTDDAGETAGQAAKRRLTSLQHRVSAYDRVFAALQSRPESDAASILSRIRQGHDVDAIARHLSHGDLLLQMSLVPESKYRYVFPVVDEMPAYLIRPDNPYLDSIVYEWTARRPRDADRSAGEGSSGVDGGSLHTATEKPHEFYLKPYHAAEVVDVLLSAAQPSKWTEVSTDDVLMRRLLSRYFLVEYGGLTFFQKDYFLQDMVEMRRRLCSSLLVNAALAIACFYEPALSNRAEFWNPDSLGYRFIAEARRLWEIEQGVSKLTTIQAGLVINVIYNICGVDRVGWSYTERAAAMARDLGLLQGLYRGSARLCDAGNFTAWALFNWQAMVSFSFHRPPLLCDPPAFTLPDPAENPAWYGELWIRYSLSEVQYPVQFAHLFKSLSELAVVMNDAASHLFGSPPRNSTAALAALCSRFTNWYNKLPGPLHPRNVALPSQLKLQCVRPHSSLGIHTNRLTTAVYYDVLLDAFGVHPQNMVDHARVCFETLLRLYYLRHGADRLDTTCNAFFLQQGFMCLKDLATHPQSPSVAAWRSTLILAAKCLYDQGGSAHFARVLYQVLHDQMPADAIAELGRFAGTQMSWKDDIHYDEIRTEYVASLNARELIRVGMLIESPQEDLEDESSDEAAPSSSQAFPSDHGYLSQGPSKDDATPIVDRS
ncbi:hypothetical protein QBC47DRAFT_289520 [Echria macrotheca]|uniref:Zn(2)-C6 fungal-type domain-containing protein n=1 Tax=Echria macrotheca TaxID=438768 RepID=A0AAJ0FAK8_9PEZI|nr:hypothetical protein QBC47DRAFT_289520 [Echria macrotheca]